MNVAALAGALLLLAGCLEVQHHDPAGKPVEATVRYCTPDAGFPYCFPSAPGKLSSLPRVNDFAHYACSDTRPPQPPAGPAELWIDAPGYEPLRTLPVLNYQPVPSAVTAGSLCPRDTSYATTRAVLHRKPTQWDPGIYRRCQTLGVPGDVDPPYWLDAGYCPDGFYFGTFLPAGRWVWQENNEHSTHGIVSSCGENGTRAFSRSWRPDFRTNLGVGDPRPRSPFKLTWTERQDGSYSVIFGSDFLAAGYGQDGKGIGSPCCGTGAQCEEEAKAGTAYYNFIAMTPAGPPVPDLTLAQAHLRGSLRVPGFYAGPAPGASGGAFFGFSVSYARPAATAYPSCTTNLPLCVERKRETGCEWCDAGEPTTSSGCRGLGDPYNCCTGAGEGACGYHGLSAYFLPRSERRVYYEDEQRAVMTSFRKAFNGEGLGINVSKLGLAPVLGQTAFAAVDVKLGQLWEYGRTYPSFNRNGCGGPGKGCARCGSSCIPGSCQSPGRSNPGNDGGCNQLMFAEAPPADTLAVSTVGVVIEPSNNSTFYVEVADFAVGR